MTRPNSFYLAFVILSLTVSGCATAASQAAIAKQKEEIALKKKHFTTLLDQMQQQTLQKGLTIATIREKFGNPDDSFQSGSGESSLEIWTYERITTKSEEEVKPIRLFFNNGKLQGWEY